MKMRYDQDTDALQIDEFTLIVNLMAMHCAVTGSKVNCHG